MQLEDPGEIIQKFQGSLQGSAQQVEDALVSSSDTLLGMFGPLSADQRQNVLIEITKPLVRAR